MDPKDFFRGFFGIPPRHPRFQRPSEESEDFENESQEQNSPGGFHGSFRFFTNPLEMETFFSQQFDEILKQFGFNGAENFPKNFSEGFQNKGLNENNGEENPRDFMLKKDDHPGYLKPDHSKERHDVEIDGLPDDFGKFHNEPAKNPDFIRTSQEGFTRNFNFGHSFSSSSSSYSSSSVRLPDGSIEEKQVTKDNEGRETTKVIKRSGEDCYTITTIKHPDGREESEESNICPRLNDFNRTFRQQTGDQESLVDKIFRF